jgi:hypothetical protein
MQSSEFFNTGVLMARAIAVIDSAVGENQYRTAKKFCELAIDKIEKELSRRRGETRQKYGMAGMGKVMQQLAKDKKACQPIKNAIENHPRWTYDH